MKITCPNCEASYKLADGALGATGRKVRCTRCGTVWHATADVEPVEPPLERAAAKFREPSEDEWKAALSEDGSPVAERSAPAARSSQPDPRDDFGDADADSDAGGDAGPETGSNVVPFKARDPDEGDATPDDAREDTGSAAPTIDAEPPGFEAEKRPKRTQKPQLKRRAVPSRTGDLISPRGIVSIATTFVMLVVVGAFFAREDVVRLIPDLAGLYRLVGLEVNLRGLDYSEVKTYREVDGATPVLVVEGVITNVTEDAVAVPTLRFALKSAAGREVYAWTMDPPRESLEPAETVRFKSRLPAPPDAASDVEVRFTDRRGP